MKVLDLSRCCGSYWAELDITDGSAVTDAVRLVGGC